ncbi:unnamed protein product [Ilex paraguariensis]|uniref:Uncharacterized protein n=1 Tax=Ilex paraguariensis TaxID=185542 RepID=A0ABC8SGE6_9AQUA
MAIMVGSIYHLDRRGPQGPNWNGNKKVEAGITLGELRYVADLYDFHSMATLFLVGVVTVTPTLTNSKSRS